MRRPAKAVVEKAIRDSGGNLSAAAVMLGCSRAALYTWIYQFGLERLAGVQLEPVRSVAVGEHPRAASFQAAGGSPPLAPDPRDRYGPGLLRRGGRGH